MGTSLQCLAVATDRTPTRPRHVDPYARACLEALSSTGAGRWISVGGAFGIAHYDDYRATHDVDAWWMPEASRANRDACVRVLEDCLGRFGSVRTRAWGDVVSVELQLEGRTAFSFQIASRVGALSEP